MPSPFIMPSSQEGLENLGTGLLAEQVADLLALQTWWYLCILLSYNFSFISDQ